MDARGKFGECERNACFLSPPRTSRGCPWLDIRTAKATTNSFVTEHADTSYARKKRVITTKSGWKGNRVLPGNYEWNDQEIFQDQIFIQRIVNFLLRSEKRTNFLYARDHVVDSACLNLCLLKSTARILCRFDGVVNF